MYLRKDKTLPMNGGTGETSYAKNSRLQQTVISLTKPIREEAIASFYSTNLFPKSLSIADMGCSSGPNTLLVISELVKAVDRMRKKFCHESPEYVVYLNDLPENDFNTVFLSLPALRKCLEKEMGDGSGPIFFNGVPGSFYGRLFPRNSLHFVHSSYSLMWLSKVPEGVEDNKREICIGSTSPASVIKAYYERFQKDFSSFLRCRSEELVGGGRMVLTLLGRKGEDHSRICYIYELLGLALNDMVHEGIIKKQKLHSFNIPLFTASLSEVESEIEEEGSFVVDRSEVSEIIWSACGRGDDEIISSTSTTNISDDSSDHEDDDGGYINVSNCIRSIIEPLLVAHFGDGVIDDLFVRYRSILRDRLAKHKATFINVIVSLIRKHR